MPAATLRRSLVVSSEFTGSAIQSREPSTLLTAASSCRPQACQIFRHGPGLDPHPRLLIKWRSGARRKQERPRTRSGSSLTKRRYWCQTRSAMILAAGPGLSKNVVSLATLLPQLHPDSNILRWICGAGIAALACQVDRSIDLFVSNEPRDLRAWSVDARFVFLGRCASSSPVFFASPDVCFLPPPSLLSSSPRCHLALLGHRDETSHLPRCLPTTHGPVQPQPRRDGAESQPGLAPTPLRLVQVDCAAVRYRFLNERH